MRICSHEGIGSVYHETKLTSGVRVKNHADYTSRRCQPRMPTLVASRSALGKYLDLGARLQ